VGSEGEWEARNGSGMGSRIQEKQKRKREGSVSSGIENSALFVFPSHKIIV
jgi:hypothetical protein